MKNRLHMKAFRLAGALIWAFPSHSQANLIVNGGFESGLDNWTVVDQAGSDGTFYLQSGAGSPINGLPVSAPPEGGHAAMTDAQAGGGHVLYQDFSVPIGVLGGNIQFSLFWSNGAEQFYTPANLNWAASNTIGSQNLNQQIRVDILGTAEDVFGVTVLQNLFQTQTASPLVSGYDSFTVDLGPLLLGHQGETLRLRFAETDNVSYLNLGVDRVSLSTVVPLPSAMALAFSGLSGLLCLQRRRNIAVPDNAQP